MSLINSITQLETYTFYISIRMILKALNTHNYIQSVSKKKYTQYKQM